MIFRSPGPSISEHRLRRSAQNYAPHRADVFGLYRHALRRSLSHIARGQKVIPERALRLIVQRVHAVPELAGCLVGYHGGGQCRVIGYPSCVTPNSENVAVLIEEVILPPLPGSDESAPPPVPTRATVTNRSKLGPELIGAGANCGLTVVSALGMAAGVASELPTGGASTFLVIASWSGLAMGGIMCANGLVRVGAALVDLEDDTLQAWDDNRIYVTAMLLVDAIGVAGAVSSLPFAVRELWGITVRLRAFRSLNLSFDALKRMNRLQRMRTLSTLFQEASRTNEGVTELVVAARKAQMGARAMQRSGSLSVRHAETLRDIIDQATVRRLDYTLRSVLGSMAGVGVSSTPSDQTGSGSGSVNWVIHLLDGGQPNF